MNAEDMREAMGEEWYKAAKAVQSSPDRPEWITWSGGKCPVGQRALVEVRLRSGRTITSRASIFDWSNDPIMTDGGFSDIIAYHVVTL